MRPALRAARLWRMISPLTFPFVLVYAMGVRLKNAAYDSRLFKPQRLAWPVLCIGNLSVGGTGKTPLVLLLAELLAARGWSADVLSRGYGRRGSRVVRVDPLAAGEAALNEFGDEPIMMARRGVPVFVGSNRHLAGLLAESAASGQGAARRGVHLLDDGFQHRKLARTVDIVLLQRADLADDLLPAGRLREPLCALERADICVLRAEDADLRDRVLRLMRQGDPTRVWLVERRTTLPGAFARGEKCVAFCAVGDPDGFFDGLRLAPAQVADAIAFRDHHPYTRRDMEQLSTAARRSGATCFVTTEKDSVRLGGELRAELEKNLPLYVAGLDVRLGEEEHSLATLESLMLRAGNETFQFHSRGVR